MIMNSIDTPSWLTSWIAWRNHYTVLGEMPFNVLATRLSTWDYSGLHLTWDRRYPDCPHCLGNFVVRDKEFGLVYCLCQVLAYQARQYHKYREIMSEIQPATLDELEITDEIGAVGKKLLKKGIDEAERFIKRPDKWLLYSGSYGTGKTHILRAITTALYPMAVYIASRDLEHMVHKYRKADDLGFLYETLRYAPILLLDDLGMEYGGPLMGSTVDRIVDARYARYPEYPVVAATNLVPSQLPDYVPRAADRLMDKQKVVRIGFKGSSYRALAR